MKILAFVLLVAGALSVNGRGQSNDAAAAALAAPVVPGSGPASPLEKMWEARREGAKRSQWDIGVDLAMVAVEQGKALDLIPDLESGEQEKVDAAWDKIQAMDPTVLDDGKRVHVELAPKRVELLEMEKSDSRMNEGKTVVREMLPLFGVSSTNESLTVTNDKYQLVGVHVLTKPKGWIELHLVRVRWAMAK